MWKRMRWLVFTLILSIAGFSVRAQKNNTLYFLPRVAQANLLNPAFTTSCNYIGIPVLSSIHFDAGNTGFSYNQLLPPSSSPRIPDMNFLNNSLHNLDLLSTELHTNLFSAGMWYKEYYFHFSIIEKVNAYAYMPDDLFSLAWKGNTQYVGQTADISRVGASLNYYREYSVSASKWIHDDLKVGIRPKLLFGKLNLSTKKEDISIYTDEEKYDLDIRANYLINSSLPLTVEENEQQNELTIESGDVNPSRLLLNRKNVGFAADFGGIYNYSKDIRLYASVIDLGFINWRSNLNNILINQDFQYRGLTDSDFQADNYLEGMVDSLQDSWELETSNERYVTFLPLKVYAGATYDLNDEMNIGLLNRNLLFKKRIFPSLTLSYNAFLYDFLSLSASYSYSHYSFNNLGLGLSLQNKSVQFYIVTDNILAIKPLSVRNVNLRFGLNIFFNCKEKEMTDDYKTTHGGANCYWIERHLQQEKIKPKK